MALTSFISGMRPGKYDAACENISCRKHEPKDQDPSQVVDLKLRLLGITPFDLKDTSLLHAAFNPKQGGEQQHIEEELKDPAQRERAAFNSRFENFDLNKGFRSDTDASSKLRLSGPAFEGGSMMVYPTHGIELKEIVPAEPVNGHPACSLVISVKGCDADLAGYELLINELQVRFMPKTKEEVAKDTAAKLKDEAAPGQQTLDDAPRSKPRASSPEVEAAVNADVAAPVKRRPGRPPKNSTAQA